MQATRAVARIYINFFADNFSLWHYNVIARLREGIWQKEEFKLLEIALRPLSVQLPHTNIISYL